MIGGIFAGTNGDPVNGPYTTIYTITVTPPDAWTTANVTGLPSYRYLCYFSPNNSYGNIAEMKFYHNGVQITGTGFGTAGSYGNDGNVFAMALDGITSTFFDENNPNGNYVGIDTGSSPTPTPTPNTYADSDPNAVGQRQHQFLSSLRI